MSDTVVTPCKHEWRMFTREPIYIGISHYHPAGGVSHTTEQLTGYKELWYCIKCRREEERIVDDQRSSI